MTNDDTTHPNPPLEPPELSCPAYGKRPAPAAQRPRSSPAVRSRRFALTLLVILSTAIASRAEETVEPEPFVDKEFVIVKSTSSFKEAGKVAASAAAKLGVRLDLRGLSAHKRTGLTFSKQECRQSEFSYPCYVPRGRDDDGTYVSVEWSSAYEHFAKGLYLVMVASDVPGSTETSRMLASARRTYRDAYAKRARVYVGCMH